MAGMTFVIALIAMGCKSVSGAFDRSNIDRTEVKILQKSLESETLKIFQIRR